MGEDHFRQMDHHLARPEAAILSVVRTTTTFEQENINELMIGQHGEQIKSLKEKIEEKNEEISRLEKAMKELEDKNKKLDIALKTRIEEITKLKSRIHKLETEKKGLEDKLRNVEGKLERVEKEVEELEKANVAHEEENASLKEHLQIISGEVESVKQDLEHSRRENHNLKKEVKDLQDTHQKLFSFGVREGRPMLAPPQQPDLQASLRLGELSRQLQAKMYAFVFPQSYTPIANYKVKTIRRDLQRLPKTEEEKETARKKWDELQKKLKWDDMYEETLKLLQDNRNVEAHPKISTKLLQEAADTMDDKGNLKGWISREYIDVLIAMWRQLQSSECSVHPKDQSNL
ncbi:uncharacterized protein [Porites lutea]|uniref:uncharacterized protein n=1 Tax=Porites lutea TaxID=51062 RepID=UPI003CC69016